MKITVRELREISDALLNHIESLGVREVEVDDDYYWAIPREQLYDASVEAVQPSLGQLTDDWNELQMIRRGERPPVALALGWLASIMRAVGERVVG